MKKFILWSLAFIITVSAAIYQRHTGPTYPKKLDVTVNGQLQKLKLVRSLALDERPEVKLNITDTTVRAKIYFKRFRSDEEYQSADFQYRVYPVHSFVMNKIFKMTEEKGFFAEVPQQPAAGKIQYYFEIADSKGIQTFFRDKPVVIRFKGGVPGSILIPHISVHVPCHAVFNPCRSDEPDQILSVQKIRHMDSYSAQYRRYDTGSAGSILCIRRSLDRNSIRMGSY